MSEDKPIVEGFQLIHKKLLTVDRSYQRPLKLHHVRHIGKEYDPDMMLALVVSYRDGVFYIVEGQHRWKMAMLRDDVEYLWCYVHFWTLEKEAEMFRKFNATNARIAVSPGETLRAGVVAKDPGSVELNEVMRKYGFTTTEGEANYVFVKWTGTIMKYYRTNPLAVHWMLEFLARSVHVDYRHNKLPSPPAITMFHVKALFKLYKANSVRTNFKELAAGLGRYGMDEAHLAMKTVLPGVRYMKLAKLMEFGKPHVSRLVDPGDFGPVFLENF